MFSAPGHWVCAEVPSPGASQQRAVFLGDRARQWVAHLDIGHVQGVTYLGELGYFFHCLALVLGALVLEHPGVNCKMQRLELSEPNPSLNRRRTGSAGSSELVKITLSVSEQG